MHPTFRIVAALGLAAASAACGGDQAQNNVTAAAPAGEPLPTAGEMADDAALANEAAQAEALDAEIGGNNSGADANLQ